MNTLPDTVPSKQATARLCANCAEPIPLLRNFPPYDESLCEECDEELWEADRRAAWESHAEDLAEMAAMDRAEGWR